MEASTPGPSNEDVITNHHYPGQSMITYQSWDNPSAVTDANNDLLAGFDDKGDSDETNDEGWVRPDYDGASYDLYRVDVTYGRVPFEIVYWLELPEDAYSPLYVQRGSAETGDSLVSYMHDIDELKAAVLSSYGDDSMFEAGFDVCVDDANYYITAEPQSGAITTMHVGVGMPVGYTLTRYAYSGASDDLDTLYGASQVMGGTAGFNNLIDGLTEMSGSTRPLLPGMEIAMDTIAYNGGDYSMNFWFVKDGAVPDSFGDEETTYLPQVLADGLCIVGIYGLYGNTAPVLGAPGDTSRADIATVTESYYKTNAAEWAGLGTYRFDGLPMIWDNGNEYYALDYYYTGDLTVPVHHHYGESSDPTVTSEGAITGTPYDLSGWADIKGGRYDIDKIYVFTNLVEVTLYHRYYASTPEHPSPATRGEAETFPYEALMTETIYLRGGDTVHGDLYARYNFPEFGKRVQYYSAYANPVDADIPDTPRALKVTPGETNDIILVYGPQLASRMAGPVYRPTDPANWSHALVFDSGNSGLTDYLDYVFDSNQGDYLVEIHYKEPGEPEPGTINLRIMHHYSYSGGAYVDDVGGTRAVLPGESIDIGGWRNYNYNGHSYSFEEATLERDGSNNVIDNLSSVAFPNETDMTLHFYYTASSGGGDGGDPEPKPVVPDPTPHPDPNTDNFEPSGPEPAEAGDLPGLTLIFDDGVPLVDLPGTGGDARAAVGFGAFGAASLVILFRHWRRRDRGI